MKTTTNAAHADKRSTQTSRKKSPPIPVRLSPRQKRVLKKLINKSKLTPTELRILREYKLRQEAMKAEQERLRQQYRLADPSSLPWKKMWKAVVSLLPTRKKQNKS